MLNNLDNNDNSNNNKNYNFSNNGREWEQYLANVYQAEQTFFNNSASESGDFVANGIQYQVKSANGVWESIHNLQEFKHHILNVCKADRYLLKIGTHAEVRAGQERWVDINKRELILLAENGYIRFDRKGFGRQCAKWSITVKKSLILINKFGIKPVVE